MSKPIVGIKAVGNFVVIRRMRAQETIVAMSGMVIPDSVQGAPQGIIVELGPMVSKIDYGFKAGDRVLLQGSCVPIPAVQGSGDELNVVNPHDIKCVLVEGE